MTEQIQIAVTILALLVFISEIIPVSGKVRAEFRITGISNSEIVVRASNITCIIQKAKREGGICW